MKEQIQAKIAELEGKIEKQVSKAAKLKNDIGAESRIDDLCCELLELEETII